MCIMYLSEFPFSLDVGNSRQVMNVNSVNNNININGQIF